MVGFKLTYSFGNKNKVSDSKKITSTSVVQNKFISNSWRQHNIYMAGKFFKTLGIQNKGKPLNYGNLVHEMLSKIISKEDV